MSVRLTRRMEGERERPRMAWQAAARTPAEGWEREAMMVGRREAAMT